MNASIPAAGRSRLTGRVQFVLLALLFMAPFAGAWVLFFYFPDARPAGTTNYGQLVTPPRELPDLAWQNADGSPASAHSLQGKWLLVQVVGEDCEAACAERLLTTRQTRVALAGERERVRRVVLAPSVDAARALQARLGAEHGDVLWLAGGGEEARAFFGSAEALALFLVDPAGNYLMVYPEGRTQQADFRGMKKDITKLLKLSRLG